MKKASPKHTAVIPFHPELPKLPRLTATEIGVKGRSVLEMARLKAPVAPGLVLPAGLCRQVLATEGSLPQATQTELRKGLDQLEEWSGRQFGSAEQPLLVSVRTSTPPAIPNGMPTIVNVGCTRAAAEALGRKNGDALYGWDAYRRLIESYAVNALGLAGEGFAALREEALEREGAEADHEMSPEAMRTLTEAYRTHYEELTGQPWQDDPNEHLRTAIEAGFRSWASPTAEAYRAEYGLDHLEGLGVLVQVMAEGTALKDSGAGRLLTRMPGTGEKKPSGQFLDTALGTDLTAGIRMTDPVTQLEKKMPELWASLQEWADKLERHFHDAQDIQFAVERGELRILLSRPIERTARASLRIALDMNAEGICDERQALAKVNPMVVEEYLHPVLDKSEAPDALTKGLPASPGSAVGQVVFFAEQAVELAAQGVKTILVRHETSPEDIDGLKVAQGIVTIHGGLTSHAAVVARGMGKCCVVGASAISINYHINEMTIGETVVKRMDWVSIDGNTGEIYAAQLPQVEPTLEGGIAQVLEWADRHRRLGVYTNADTAKDAAKALELGAEGIGLCRTEHMFFEIDRIPVFRRMILAVNEEGRSAALSDLLPLQRRDFLELFRVMEGRPVTIRLLDPPLNEFLPKGIRSQTRMSRAMGLPVEVVQQRIESLSEANPMMGHRGCRLAVTYPEIYNMQVRAIVEAACIVKKEGCPVKPEIMVPLVSTPRELALLRGQIERLVKQVMAELDEDIPFKIGTMIETPRATVASRAIGRHADFFSFGTNDLTQMSYGFSRDDAGLFLPMYLDKGLLDEDPFVRLDQVGIGRLMRIACEDGRTANPQLKLGICGEHGGEPHSVRFCHQLGLDYVSCSPYRIPVARLAAGQAAVEALEQ